MKRMSVVVLGLVAAGIAAACGGNPPPPPPPPPAAPAINQDSIDSVRRAEEERRRREAEEAARRRAEEERRRAEEAARRESERLRNIMVERINFDYDKSEIRASDATILDRKIPILRANASLRIRIAGHCDERGSDEYNLALGNRRASAAKDYLTSRGIAASRIEVVSFGEERPTSMGHDESAWAQNRRDEFEIIAGGERLTQP